MAKSTNIWRDLCRVKVEVFMKEIRCMSPEYLLQVDPMWVKTSFRVTSICQRFMSFKEVDNMHRQAKIRAFMPRVMVFWRCLFVCLFFSLIFIGTNHIRLAEGGIL